MEILLTKEQFQAFQKAMETAEDLYSGRFFEGMLGMRHFIKGDSDVTRDVCEKLAMIVAPESSFRTAEITGIRIDHCTDDDNVTVTTDDEKAWIIAEMLELVVRLSLGQWNSLCKVHYDEWYMKEEKTKKVYSLRNRLFKNFKELKTFSESFGIAQATKETRIVYDIYKEIMYEAGAEGVYRFKPRPFSETKEPVVTFKALEEFVMTKDFSFENYRWLGKLKQLEDGYWFPVEENRYQKALPGEKVSLKRNGYFRIEGIERSR